MKTERKPIDRFFFLTVLALLGVGIIIFISASFGILAKNETKFYGVLFNQLIFGVGGGLIALSVASKIPYKFWRNYSLYLFIASIAITLLVFVPALGFSHGGARRWISLGPVSFQPVEFLKIGFVIYFAAWLSWVKNRVSDIRFGVLPLIILLSIIALVLFKQPDTKSFMLMLAAALSMLFVSGISWKYIIGLLVGGALALGILVAAKPYLFERVQTFLNPSHDAAGSSYQLIQSLNAIGSGGIFGRGLGQSVQKFSYLPEPQGDSIFAVVGEEFGFVGATGLIVLFIIFCLRGLWIASRIQDAFGRLLVVGIVILLVAQSFLNIASIIGVFPLTGVPLVFISHGGTALLIALFAVGIVLNVSRSLPQKEKE